MQPIHYMTQHPSVYHFIGNLKNHQGSTSLTYRVNECWVVLIKVKREETRTDDYEVSKTFRSF